MGRAMLSSVCRGGKVDVGNSLALLLLLAAGVGAMDCSRFPMWNECRGAVAYHGVEELRMTLLLQSLLPESPKRSQMVDHPIYLARLGWRDGYARNPYMVNPRHTNQQGLSINDPSTINPGFSIYDPRGKKATPLQRYLRNGNHLFSTIIRKQIGGLKEGLEEM